MSPWSSHQFWHYVFSGLHSWSLSRGLALGSDSFSSRFWFAIVKHLIKCQGWFFADCRKICLCGFSKNDSKLFFEGKMPSSWPVAFGIIWSFQGAKCYRCAKWPLANAHSPPNPAIPSYSAAGFSWRPTRLRWRRASKFWSGGFRLFLLMVDLLSLIMTFVNKLDWWSNL